MATGGFSAEYASSLHVGELSHSQKTNIAQTVSAFVASQADELSVLPNQEIRVLEQFEDGWTFVSLVDESLQGFVPSCIFQFGFIGKRSSGFMSIPYRRDSLRRLTVTLDIASAEVQSNTTSDYVILTHKVRSLLQKKAVRARKASNCGPFSLVFCGDSGIGKTSLIHAFTESEDFVKMDSPHSHVIPDSTNTIQEIMASTIPHMSLAYGEKQENITFVDTPGFGSFMDAMTVIQPCIEYLIQKFRETDTIFTKKTSSARLNQLFKQAGLGHVDVCLYCILHRVKSVDLEFMRVLAGHVSLVPLIVKSDTMTLEEVFALKLNILEQLSCANIPIYGFGLGEGELMSLARSKVGGGVPFAVSTKGVDGKIAFGGECMNEIVLLRKQLFCNHVADFRALGAERFVSWRTRYQS